MKSILVPVEKHELITSMLECATRLAGSFSGTVEGVALRLPQISVGGSTHDDARSRAVRERQADVDCPSRAATHAR